VTRIVLHVAGTCDILRSIALDYDTEGRLVELQDESATRSYRLSYGYDAAGTLEEEVFVHWGRPDDGELSIQTASHRRDEAAEDVRRVEVRDGVGRLLEAGRYAPHGGMLESRSHDGVGRLVRLERAEFHEDGRVARSWRFVYHGPGQDAVDDEPARRLREDYTYDPADGSLTRRRLTEEVRIAQGPGRSTWRTTVDEVIHYVQGVPGRDETRFFEIDLDGEVAECQRLAIDYDYDDQRRLVEMRVVEQDLRTGETHQRISRFGHRQVPEGATGPLLREIWNEDLVSEEPQGAFECRVDRLYQADGELRRLLIYERSSHFPAGLFSYD
jgi:hypothetical protein